MHGLVGRVDGKRFVAGPSLSRGRVFVNPHGSLTITVKGEGGAATPWVFTLGSATALAQRGVGKTGPNALHVGDIIKVKYIPAKDGSALGFLKSVTYPDGHVIVVSGGGPND
jgi:hypothetical protein